MTELKVVELHPKPVYEDAVAALRNIANEIEAGEYGEVKSVAIVTFGDTLEVFCAGPDNDGGAAALLLQAAAMRLIREVEQAGR